MLKILRNIYMLRPIIINGSVWPSCKSDIYDSYKRITERVKAIGNVLWRSINAVKYYYPSILWTNSYHWGLLICPSIGLSFTIMMFLNNDLLPWKNSVNHDFCLAFSSPYTSILELGVVSWNRCKVFILVPLIIKHMINELINVANKLRKI